MINPDQLTEAPAERRWYWSSFVICAILALVPIWIGSYVPMVDLPHHAAQIFLWQHYHDPQFNFAARFEFNWFTPYLIGYVIARLGAVFLPTVLAIKVVVSLATVGLPLSVHVLLSRVRGERYWALLGFPLAFGFSFYWGFLNFLVATPIAIVLVALAYSYPEKPSLAQTCGMAAFMLLLGMAHGLAFAIAGPAALLLIATRTKDIKAAIFRVLPVALPTVLVAASIRQMQSWEFAKQPDLWQFRPWQRVLDFPSMLLGYPGDKSAAAVGVVLLLILAAGGTLHKNLRAWIPCACALLIYLFAPYRGMGTFFVYERSAPFVVIFALMGLAPRIDLLLHQSARAVIVCIVMGWLALLAVRFHGFDKEAAGFQTLLANMQPGKRILSLMFDKESRFVGGVPYLHFPVWYQAEKGGEAGFSAASGAPAVVVYRPRAQLKMTPGLEWYPRFFAWSRDSGYDYFVIRAPSDYGPWLFRRAQTPVVLRAHEGKWWLYENTH